MNQTYKQPWLDALRSGIYEQGSGRLVDCGRYCCLGVLQDVCRAAGVQIAEDSSIYILERKQAEEVLGLNVDQQNGLARMNDDGNSFSVIADYIEKNM